MAELISQGGPFALLAAGLGVLACLLSVALVAGAVFGAKSEIVRALSVMCVVFSVATMTAGIGGALLGRQRSDQAAAGSRPSAAERIRRAGYLESRANLKVALPFAAPAAAVAIAGFVVATRRRQDGGDDDRPPVGPAFAVLLLLLAVGVWGFGVRLLLQKLPGRELDDAGWKVLDLADALNAGDWDRCFTTPWSLGAATPAHALPAHAENQKRCAEHFTTVVDLTRLLSAQWLDDAALRDSITKRLSPAPPPDQTDPPDKNDPPPGVDNSTPAAADPALGLLESKLRHCIKKHAKVELQVTISKDGKVDLPRKSAKCLKLAVAKMKLPGPPRTLEVEIK